MIPREGCSAVGEKGLKFSAASPVAPLKTVTRLSPAPPFGFAAPPPSPQAASVPAPATTAVSRARVRDLRSTVCRYISQSFDRQHLAGAEGGNPSSAEDASAAPATSVIPT